MEVDVASPAFVSTSSGPHMECIFSQKLIWSHIAVGRAARDKVSWLELVVDLELATGINCAPPDEENSTWGEKTVLLRQVVKLILTMRGGGPEA